MNTLKNYIKHLVSIFCLSFLIFFISFNILSAEEINWIEVAKTNNEIQSIDVNSLKYNNNGLLTFVTKYSEVNQEDHKIINTNPYLMVVDCENRLFSRLPVNAEIKEVKGLIEPINDKLIKKTILNSCSY